MRAFANAEDPAARTVRTQDGCLVFQRSDRREISSSATENCKTSDVVYLIECRKCTKQYVGETDNPSI